MHKYIFVITLCYFQSSFVNINVPISKLYRAGQWVSGDTVRPPSSQSHLRYENICSDYQRHFIRSGLYAGAALWIVYRDGGI
jgi:hypothetical protein